MLTMTLCRERNARARDVLAGEDAVRAAGGDASALDRSEEVEWGVRIVGERPNSGTAAEGHGLQNHLSNFHKAINPVAWLPLPAVSG